MRVLYVYCHSVSESFHAAIRKKALAGLSAAGHECDLLDLYAEGFNPVMSADARRRYHDTRCDQAGLEAHVSRLREVDALILQFPVWSFGPPAMLKGWLARVMMPGVAFDLSDPARAKPSLHNLRRIAGVTTYGRPRWNTIAVGDRPRSIVRRYLPRFTGGCARVDYYALYHMNTASAARRTAFLRRVRTDMDRVR
jgi:putative NADPH-quinone reductase